MKSLFARGWRAAAAIASGLLLAAAFPPVGSAQAAWIALVPLLVVARFSSPGQAFRVGWCSGMVFWSVTLVWLLTLSRSGTPWVLAASGWLALAAYCALYTGAFVAAAAVVFAGDRTPGPVAPGAVRRGLDAVGRVLLLPLLWVGFEYIRATFATGFPWNALGVSQAMNLPLIQSAEWGGVYAVSALVVAVNAGVAQALLDLVPAARGGQAARRFHPELLLALLLLALALLGGWRRVQTLRAEEAGEGASTLWCAIVQLNVPQDEKWSEDLAMAVEERLILLTERVAAGDPALVIWPETSVPQALDARGAPPRYLQELAGLGAPILAGAMEAETGPDGHPRWYNSAFLIGVDGRWSGVYRKQHLVPFGEYVPLARWIPGLEALAPLGYSCTLGDSPAIMELAASPGVRLAALICFEDAIAYLARRAVRAGANLLINQTNDAWFEGTACPVQHLHQAVFRCVETRTPMVRCANMGVSGVIDRTGAIDDQTRALLAAGDAEAMLYRIDPVRVPVSLRAPTFHTRWGDLPFALPAAAVALATLWRARRLRD